MTTDSQDTEEVTEAAVNEAPVRLCCFERHWETVCPDGLVMCCLCFERWPLSDLSRIDGQLTDVCIGCHEKEELAIARMKERAQTSPREAHTTEHRYAPLEESE